MRASQRLHTSVQLPASFEGLQAAQLYLLHSHKAVSPKTRPRSSHRAHRAARPGRGSAGNLHGWIEHRARKQNRLKEHLVILHICYLQFQVQQRALTFTCWSSLQCQEFGRKIEHTCFLFACRHLTRTLIDEKYGSCKLSKGLLFKAQPFLSSMKKTSMQIYPLVQ